MRWRNKKETIRKHEKVRAYTWNRLVFLPWVVSQFERDRFFWEKRLDQRTAFSR